MRPQADQDVLDWTVAVPLWTNPLLMGTAATAIAWAVVGFAGLLSVVFLIQGEAEALGALWILFGAVGFGLFILLTLVMALVLGNRMTYRFTIDAEGIRMAMVDPRAQASNRLAIGLGLLMGRPQAMGAGLIAASQEVQCLRWRGAFRAQCFPHRQVVILRNRWRRLLVVYATAENYDAVSARIAGEIDRHGTALRVPTRSPLPRYFLLSASVVLACLPLFALADAFGVSLLLPLLQLCFGFTAIWLIGLFGYVLIAVDLLILGSLLLEALSKRESWLQRGEHFLAWTVWTDRDWGLVLLAGIGMAVLALLGWRLAHGRPPALLIADLSDAGD